MFVGFATENQIDSELSVFAGKVHGLRNLAAHLWPRTNRIALQLSRRRDRSVGGTLKNLRHHDVGPAERKKQRKENRER